MKKKSILLLLPFAAMALAGCGDNPTPPADPCESAVVQLNKTTLSLEVGASETLTASMSVEGCDLGEVTWSSDHPDIAKVENGKVTALAVGTAKIIANGAECVVTVTAQPGPVVKHVEDIRIEPNLYPSMKVGDPDYQIDFTVLPEDAENKAVTFICDTPAVATVSDAGVIHAVAAGTAKITVTSIDNAEVSKVLNLTVTAADVSMPDTTIAGYEKVMSGELVDGSLVEFISQTNGVIYGMKNYDSGNNIKASQCSVDNGVVVEGSDVALYTVEKNDDGSFSFKDSNNKYLAASVGSSNKLTAKNSKDDTCKFSVTITNGLASIVCNAQGVERGTLCLNYNNGTPLFNCYASLGKYSSITFFAKEAGEQKEIKSIELKVSNSYDKEYLDTDSWSVVGLTVEATYTDDTKGAVDPRAYNLIFTPEAPALGVTSVSVKAKMFAGSEIESPAVVIEGITVSHNEEGVRVTGITVTDAYPKMKVGDPDKQIEVTVLPENATNKEVTFVSDNTAVATVTDAGVIHAVAPGEANITVTSVDVATVTKKVEVTVTAADVVVPSVTSDEYTKVVSGELTDGSQVEFIAQTNGKVYGMKKYDSGNNIKGAECAIGEESIIIDEAVEHYFVEKNDDNTYSFKDSAGNYIYAAGGTSSNHLKAKAEKGETSKFNVTIANGVASIICAAETTTRNVMALNYNGGTPLFSCYAALGTYSPITFYEKVPEPAKLVSITADMTKKTYTEGDALDLTGLVVTGHYSDESEAEITEGFELSMAEGKTLELTDTSLVVTCGELTATISLVINPKQEEGAELTSIEVTTSDHRVFTVGDAFVEETVMAHYTKGDDANVTDLATFTGFDSSVAVAEQTINVSYTDGEITKTTSYTVEIKAAPVLSSIEVTTAPTDVEYTEGDVFNPEGMVVTAHYTEGKADADVTANVTYSTEKLVAGTESIELSYTEGEVTVKTSVNITVAEKARQALPYTATPTAGAFEGWTGEGYSAFATNYVKLGAAGNYIEYKKCFAAQPKVRVILDSYLNGTGKDPSEVKVSALNDAGEVVDYETYAPHQESASSGDAIVKAGENGRQTFMFEGEGISGLKIELTVKTANIVLTRIYVSEPPVLVSSVTLDKETMDLEYPGSNGTLEATVSPDNAENKDVEWTVSGSSVTVVDGVVTPIAVGESTVTATAKDGSGKSDSCVVTVTASEKVLTGIDIATDPDKTAYESGEKFDPTGMVVMANYEGLDPEPITDYTYSDDDLVAGQTSVEISYGGKTATVSITVTAAKGSCVENPYTIEEALTKFASLGSGEWTTSRVFIKGNVKGYAASSTNKYTLIDENQNEFTVYKSALPSGDRACIGDTVIMEGFVQNHATGGLQMTSANDGTHNDLPTTALIIARGTSTISLDSSSSKNATVTFEATATNAAEYSFTVAANEGYQVSSVKFDGNVIEGKEGVYTVKVMGNSKILVETIEEGAVVPTTLTKSITDMYNIACDAAGEDVLQKNVPTIALDDVITLSTTGDPNCGYIGASSGKPSDWRLYQAQNGNLIVTAVEGYTISSIKVTYSASNTGALFNGDTQVKSNNVVTVNGQSITLTVGNTGDKTNGQVKVTAIEVIYVAVK